MKIDRLIAAVVLMTTIAVISVSAQTRPAAPSTGAPSAAPQTAVAIPDSKVAVIYSEAFFDPKNGIARAATLATTLEREFQPRRNELQTLKTKIDALEKEINDTRNVADPKTIQTKIDSLETMKKDIKRKGEDAQEAYDKRFQDMLAPLNQDIGRALEAFAKARGITVIVDRSQAQGLLYAVESIDITRAFIADFNSKNPATASVTQP